MVDTLDSNPSAFGRESSNLFLGTLDIAQRRKSLGCSCYTTLSTKCVIRDMPKKNTIPLCPATTTEAILISTGNIVKENADLGCFPDVNNQLRGAADLLTTAKDTFAQFLTLVTEICVGGQEATELRCSVNIERCRWEEKFYWRITQERSRVLLTKKGEWVWDHNMSKQLAKRVFFDTIEDAWKVAYPVQQIKLEEARETVRRFKILCEREQQELNADTSTAT